MASADEIQKLRIEIGEGLPNLDEEFFEGDTVRFPIPADGEHFWRSLKVDLVAYGIGKSEDTFRDHPVIFTLANFDGTQKIYQEPVPPVAKDDFVRIRPQAKNSTVVTYDKLADRKSHSITVSCTAYDEDGNKALTAFLDAVEQDVRSVASVAGALSGVGFATRSTNSLLDYLLSIFSVFKDDSDPIGGSEIVCSDQKIWRRNEDSLNWGCYKWILHQESDSQESDPSDRAWYMSLWRITLTADVHGYSSPTAIDGHIVGMRSEGDEDRHGTDDEPEETRTNSDH